MFIKRYSTNNSEFGTICSVLNKTYYIQELLDILDEAIDTYDKYNKHIDGFKSAMYHTCMRLRPINPIENEIKRFRLV